MRLVELVEVVGEMIEEGLTGFRWLLFEGVDHYVCGLTEATHAVGIFV